jgi:tetratricopeptide (TPR) repeat protein
MGVVYEAEQISLGRRVALKVLPLAATLEPRQLQRFHNEARAAASLDHPHIVHVHAVGCERAVHFYAMQFIDGQTLAAMISEIRRGSGRPVPTTDQPTTAHISGQPAPAAETAPRAAASTVRTPRDRAWFRRVADLGIQAAEALDHAHQLGIVDRDVKPANLLVDGRGGLWVTDFGLAHIHSDARLTMTGDLVGTLRDMSPEQALAKRVVVDHRTDIYSLGATLYELLTLEPAFSGSDRQELLRQIAFEEPRPLRRIDRAIPSELETIVLKAMEKNPADRYATAKELADDLRRWLADEPIRARRPRVVQRACKWGRRHQAAVTAAALLLLLVLVLGGLVLWRELVQRATAKHSAESALDRVELLRQHERWDEALAVLTVAQGQLKGRGLEALRQRVEQSQRDVEMLRTLEEAYLQRAASRKGRWDEPGADRLYDQAFRSYDLDVTALAPQEAAERVRASAIGPRLMAALDDWSIIRDQLQQGSGAVLRAVADLADDDPWRRRLRGAAGQRAALEGLANENGVLSQLPANLVLLARALKKAGSDATAARLLRGAQAGHPEDFWINFTLARSLQKMNAAAAVRFYQAALALRPQSPIVHNNLGNALHEKGDLDEAIAELRKAIDLKPDFAMAHSNLANFLDDKGDLDGALAASREAIGLEPDKAGHNCNYGVALVHKGNLDGAIAAFRTAVQFQEDYAEAHCNLGMALLDRGRLDEAITEYRTAIRLGLKAAYVHTALGQALVTRGEVDEGLAEYRKATQVEESSAAAHYTLGRALWTYKQDVHGSIASLREAIRLKPDYAEAHCKHGGALIENGQFAEALTHRRRGHELGSKNPNWRCPSAQWVKDCERLVELDARLPRVLRGEIQPAGAGERLELAQLCERPCKSLTAAAARFYADAFAEKPRFVAEQPSEHRYNAACAAALAGCGAGQDAARLSDTSRADLRRQALDWLRIDLDAWRRLLDREPEKARPAVAEELQHWLGDPDFNGMRGPDALAKLPEGERQSWQQLWADVADTLARSQGKAAPQTKPARK